MLFTWNKWVLAGLPLVVLHVQICEEARSLQTHLSLCVGACQRQGTPS